METTQSSTGCSLLHQKNYNKKVDKHVIILFIYLFIMFIHILK